MLECLRNKVDWWNGCGIKPDKLLLNNLRGFHISFADYVTDDEKKTAEQVLDSCLDSGTQRVEDEMRTFMLPNQTVVTSFQNQTLGSPSPNQKQRPQDGKLYGVRLDLCRATFIGLQLNIVYLYPKDTGTGTIRIYDLITGAEKYNQAVTFTGGQINPITIDRVFSFDTLALNIAIVLETTATMYDAQPWESTCGGCAYTGRYLNNQWLYTVPVKFDPAAAKIERNAQGANHMGGLYLNYNLVCDISDYLCGASSSLKLAVWYAAGSAAMDEIIFSGRISSATTVRKDDAMALKTLYEAEYTKYMEQITKTAQVPSSPCFICNKQVTVSSRIP